MITCKYKHVRYNIPALLDHEKVEITRIETPQLGEVEFRYFPRDHRVQIESEYTTGLQSNEEEMRETIPDYIQFEGEYGEVAYEFVEVELDKDSGLWVEDEVGDTIIQILDPK